MGFPGRDQTRADQNYWIASALFMACSKTGAVRETHDLLLVHCGFPDAPFNRALPKTTAADLDDVCARSRAFFAEKALSYEVTLRTDREAEWAGRLEEKGYRRSPDIIPVMTFDLSNRSEAALRGPEVAGLSIARVDTEEDLAAFAKTAFVGFGLPAAGAGLFLGEQLAARPEVTCLIGRVAGQPAATSMIVQTGEISGIYWVATLPEYRGRGLGEALTWAAMRVGAELGGRLAVLQASKMGQPVYRRMGFEQPYAYAGWIPPAVESRVD